MGEQRIAIQRDYEANVRQLVWISNIYKTFGALRPGAVYQAVQLLKFSPLAFPSDVLLFRFAPQSLSMKHEKAVPAMSLVEP